jgi:5'-nucleotidase
MTTKLNQKLVIAISSRALFDLEESHRIFEQQGVKAYANYQIAHETDPLPPGLAYPLVQKLLSLHSPETQEPLVEVILLSRNSADTGLRIFNSIKEHGMNITRAAFTNGESPYQYVSAFSAHLFLSTHSEDVRKALSAGCAAATIYKGHGSQNQSEQLRIAFDGDSVLFSDEAERIYQQHGLAAFSESEQRAADQPLTGGPFKGFLQALHHIQSQYPIEHCPIRTALITARSAPAHERVIKTFRTWNIRIDDALFLGGLEKGAFLKAFNADFFFDDQATHCQSASHHVPTGHVPHGIMN